LYYFDTITNRWLYLLNVKDTEVSLEEVYDEIENGDFYIFVKPIYD